MISIPRSAVIGSDPAPANTCGTGPFVGPLSRHLDSIYSDARQLMTEQGAQSMSDLVSTDQFDSAGPHHTALDSLSSDVPREAS